MRISVGICAYNEEGNIAELIQNVLKQPLPQKCRLEEIVVISSGSTDQTDVIVNTIAKKEKSVKLISENERRGKAQALNTLLQKAKGEILVVVSADAKLANDSLAKLVESFAERVGGACAKTLPVGPDGTIMTFCNSFLWKVHNRLLYEESRNGTLAHLGGDTWAIKNGIVDHIPTDVINDDAYLGVTIRRKGWQIVFVPNANVSINGPATPIEYIQQRERIVIGHKQVREITGMEPSTIGAIALRKPLFSLRIIVDEIRTNRPLHYPKILIGLFLEVLAQSIAKFNYRKRDQYIKWKQIRSTKNSFSST